MTKHQASIVSTSRFSRTVMAGLWIALLPGIACAERPVRYGWFVDFSPDGTSVVTSYGGWEHDEGGEIRVWDVIGTLRWKATQERGLRAATWSPRGGNASGSYRGNVVLFDAASGERRLEVSTGGDFAEVVQLTPDQQIAGAQQFYAVGLRGK